MGLLNKLKNALFEEEEIDLEATPDKVIIKDEEPVKPKPVEEFKEKKPVQTERDLFKVENTFNFPDFDEEEFLTSYEPPKPSKPPVRRSENTYVNKEKTQEKPLSKRKKEKNSTKEQPITKTFKPSPVISPVYGILDKNYKKEDFVKKTKSPENKKTVDVDTVRKKAFGTLEEDIEKTLDEKPVKSFYKESKSIDELLNESIDDTIELNYEKPVDEYEEESKIMYNEEDFTNNIEEELDKVNEKLELKEERKNKTPKKKKEYVEEDTLENDLFDLIDSMYEDREDE